MRDPGDTKIGGPLRNFPTTIWTQILEAADPTNAQSKEQLEALLHVYWKPVFTYVRVAWRKPVEDAKDCTQAFFAMLLEKDYLTRLRPERGSFRGYLKTALKHFLINRQEAESARRRHRPLISLDAPQSELDRLGLASSGDDPEKAYDREWFRTLFENAIETLRTTLTEDGKQVYFEVFRKYCFGSSGPDAMTKSALMAQGDASAGPTYQELAEEYTLQESDVRNYLSYTRRMLRQILKEHVREYVASDDDVEGELLEGASA